MPSLFLLKALNKGPQEELSESLFQATRSSCFHIPVSEGQNSVPTRGPGSFQQFLAHAMVPTCPSGAARMSLAGWAGGHLRPWGTRMWCGRDPAQFLGLQAPPTGLCTFLSCPGPGHRGRALSSLLRWPWTAGSGGHGVRESISHGLGHSGRKADGDQTSSTPAR